MMTIKDHSGFYIIPVVDRYGPATFLLDGCFKELGQDIIVSLCVLTQDPNSLGLLLAKNRVLSVGQRDATLALG